MTKSESAFVVLVGVVFVAGRAFVSGSEGGFVVGSLLRRLRFGAIEGAEGSSTCFPTELNRRGIFPRPEEDLTLDVFTFFVCSVTGLTRLHYKNKKS